MLAQIQEHDVSIDKESSFRHNVYLAACVADL